MVRLLIQSREPFLVKGLEAILRRVGGFQLLAVCSTIMGLRQEMARSSPDVVLLELGPDATFAALAELKEAMGAKLVLWVNAISPSLAVQAMSLGVRGILRKGLSPKLQVECLQKVYSGDVWFEKAILDGFGTAKGLPLTRREGQILNLLSQGLRNKEIATHLNISEGTVKVYLTKLLQKVGAKDRFELALFGLKNSAGRLLDSEEPSTGIPQEACVFP